MISVITLLAVIKKRSRFVDSLVSNLSAAPPSQDLALDTLLDVAGRFYAEKNYLSAEKAYLKVLRVDHKNSLAYSRLGFIYSHLGNNEDAIECFQIVADTYPNAASYHNLAMMYFKTRDYKKSATALEKSLDMEMHVNRLVNLARIYRIMNKFDLQLEALKKAHHLDPSNIDIMQLLAEAFIHEKDDKSARVMFTRILKVDPKNNRARLALQTKSQLKNI
ncbi:MAG: tetratricopeptide repeat protein [Candidatus Saccharibacteria bacterium]